MPLESLDNEQINIHDLTLEQEKRPDSVAEEQYTLLKKLIYNESNKHWEFCYPKESLNEDTTFTDIELLDVIVDYNFDKLSSKENFDKTNGLLFDENRSFWSQYVENNIVVDGESASDQLLGIWAETLFDKQSALKDFLELKKTPLYDEAKNLWQIYMESDVIKNNGRKPVDQLIAAMVESKFDRESAKNHFNTLRQSELYDKENGTWRGILDPNDFLNDASYEIGTQLLGTLVESEFDKESAKEQYHKLKLSPYYDGEQKLWRSSLKDEKYLALDNLFGILCEREFIDNKPDLHTSTPPLPETRSY